MSIEEIKNRIAQLNIEDFIWIIYILIIILSYYSNSLERKYLLFNDNNNKERYRKIIIIIFSILIVVYVFFLKNSVEDIKNLKPTDSEKKKKLVYLSFIASLFIAVSGFIFLYIAVTDEDLNIELAFN